MAERKVTFIVGSNIQSFQKGMRSVQKKLTNVSKNLKSLGNTMSASVTAPILALGGLSLKAWDTQAKAIAQVEAGLQSTGGAVGYTSEQLQKMAADLQGNTLFGDEEILAEATSQLLTFTNIAGEQFARTQEAALDLATRLDGDLKSASIQLGKALNDPVANLSALSRSGIQFSDSQKKVIKDLADSGRLMEAQNIILDELNAQYGGSAEAAAAADSGLIQLKNTLGDVAEGFGKIIKEAIRPFLERAKEIAERVNDLDRESKVKIMKFAGALAAIGPIITGLGIGFGALAVTIGALTSPVTLVIGAIAGLAAGIMYVYDNWSAITERMSDISWWRNALIDMVQFFIDYNPFNLLIDSFNAILRTFGRDEITNPLDSLSESFESLKADTKEYEHQFGSFKDSILNAVQELSGIDIGALFSLSGAEDVQLMRKEMEALSLTVNEQLAPAFQTLPTVAVPAVEQVKSSLDSLGETMSEVKQLTKSAFMEVANSGAKSLKELVKVVYITARQIIAAELAKGIASSVSSALQNVPFPLNLVAATVAGAGAAAIFNNVVPKLATGGLATAPTLAMVGDNPNAHVDPEVIAPLSKLKTMIGGGMGKQMIYVTVPLDGKVIYENQFEVGQNLQR